jgi:hypothetical protein
VATQLDSEGDVLVTSTSRLPPPVFVAGVGWWGNSKTRRGRQIHSLYAATGPEPMPADRNRAEAAAALSNGRIAYKTVGESPQIDLLDLRTNRTHTAVSFPGSASLLDLGLGMNRLAWAQQSYGWTIPANAAGCVTQTLPLDPVELVEVNLAAAPLVVRGAPVPAPTGPQCPPPA